MKITAKLAYSQLKVNRSRTLWTVVAIALSTALTTAVCSFVASSYYMLIGFLGKGFGEYGKSYFMLLLIPAIIFGVLIVSMSVTVISNVFRISAQERVSQFGIMKCTGATQRQIKSTVMYESIWLCVIGIPLGICIGLAIAFFGIQISDYFISDLEQLTHMMITEIHLSLSFVLSWQAIITAAVISFFIVIYSAWRPAYKAAKASAIDSIREVCEIKTDSKALKENKLVKKFFGFEGILADKNLKRNQHNFRATVISLSVGVILFISASGLGNQARKLQDYMNPNIDETVIAEYTSNYSSSKNETTQRKEILYRKPIDGVLGNEIREKLEEYDNSSIFGMGNDMDTFYTVLSKDQVSEKMQNILENNKQEKYECPVEIIVLDQKNYEKLCNVASVSTGSTILLNNYSYNDFGNEVNLVPFSSAINEIELVKADGSKQNIRIDGILTQKQIPQELLYPNTNPVRIVVSNAMVRGYTWYGAPEDIDGFIEYSNRVLVEEFPSGENSSYMEAGFNTRVYKINDYAKVMNIAISLVSVLVYGFVALLMLIGLTNVISTLSTNVMMRSREFAMLKSIGMTPESLKRMLIYESVLCSTKALLYGLPIGIIVTVLINLPIRSMFPISYTMPWLAIVLCILFVLLITLSITFYAVHKLKNQNIIEAIRKAC